MFEHYSIVNPVPLSRICSLIPIPRYTSIWWESNHTGHVPHLVLIKVGSIIKAIVYFCPVHTVHTFINETFCPNDHCKGMLHLSHSMSNYFSFQLYNVFFRYAAYVCQCFNNAANISLNMELSELVS